MTEQEAYREWHRIDGLIERNRKEMLRIKREVDLIQDSMMVALSHELAENPHYRKVVKRFFGKTQKGWEVACGMDRGLWKRTRRMPWPMVLEAIALSRKWW